MMNIQSDVLTFAVNFGEIHWPNLQDSVGVYFASEINFPAYFARGLKSNFDALRNVEKSRVSNFEKMSRS